MYGSHQTARDAGEHANRTACLMLMCVLVAGVGHAMPLRARQARDGRPGRFTGALRHSSSIASLRRHRQCSWQPSLSVLGADFARVRDEDYCAATGQRVVSDERRAQVLFVRHGSSLFVLVFVLVCAVLLVSAP
jgi:hypothetical protein